MNAHPAFWLLSALVVALTGWSAWRLRRDPERRRAWWLGGLRGAAAVLVAWMILQPQSRRTLTEVERPLIGVLVDTSQSMADGPPGATRADQARRWLESAAFRQASEVCDLRIFRMGGEVAEAASGDFSFDATSSRISHALDAWARRWGREEAAGLVLLSDGLDTDGAAPPVLPLPCWVLEVGPPGAAAAARVAVWQVEPPRRPVAGAETSVRAVLQGWGMDGREVPVELWSGDHKVAEKPARFTRRGEVVEIMLPLKPERPGTYPYELRVNDPAADPAARSQPFVIAVRQEGRRVLLLSNSFGFEGKFLRRAITTDRNIALDSYARWPDGRWAATDTVGTSAGAGLDLGATALAARAAVILADVSPDALHPGQWQALADFANRGGGLAVLGGPNLLGSAGAAAALGRVLPVPVPAPHLDGRFGVRLTDAGLRHPVFGPLFEAVKDFPSLQGANLASGVAVNGQVLMETIADGQARPLVVVRQEGAGRVAVVLSDTLWRWRVASPGWSGRQSPYDTFWSQMLDWIAPDQDGLQTTGRLELTTDRSAYRQGETATIQAEWIGRDAPPDGHLQATVKAPDGITRPLALRPGVWRRADGGTAKGWRGETPADSIGVHEVEATTTDGSAHRATMRFAVAASPAERRGEAPDAEFLRAVTAQSGGGYFAQADADAWLRALPAPRRKTERVIVTDIWNHPLAVCALLALLGAEWWVRRRKGLA